MSLQAVPSENRPGLTVEDWILVHLLRFTKYTGEFEVPRGMTQYGIAEAVGTGQDHVSRAVRRLIQKGLVTESKSRVEGVQERRKIYSLTIEGRNTAAGLQGQAEGIPVRVAGPGGEREVTMREALRLFESKYSILDISRAMRPDGTLDKEALGSVAQRAESAESLQNVPTPRHFVGRTRELEALRKGLEEHKMVIVHGIAGIGKTALAARLVAETRTARPVFWYRFHEWDTLRNLLSPLGDFLAGLGRRKLRTYLASKPDVDLNEVSYVLQDSVKGLRAILVFDDAHAAPDSFRPYFALLTEMLERSDGIRVLLTTRHLKPFYDRRDVVVKGVVMEIALEGLDEESSRQLLRARQIDEAHHERAYRLTEGHPLALELFHPGEGEGEGRGNISKYIEEEIGTKLTAPEKKLLRMASVYRYQVPADALLYDEELSYEVLTGLLGRALLRETPGETYDIHDFIRDYFYSRMTPHERARLHREAARFYTASPNPRSRLEFIYHSLRSGDHAEAGAAMAEHGEELIAAGHVEELKSFLDALDWKSVAGSTWGKVLILKGRACDIVGEWDKALEFYREALEASEEKHHAELVYDIGWIQQKRNLWNEAAASFQECLELAKSRNDERGIARAYHGLGRVHWRQGKWKAAAEYCRRSVERARKAGEKALEASANIELGRLLASMGDYREGEKHLRRSLKLLEGLEDKSELARAHNCLAWEIFKPQGRLDEALEIFQKGEKLALSSGNLRELAPIYHSLGEVYARKGELEKGERYLQKALGIFEKQGDDHGRAFTYLGYGILSGAKKLKVEAEEWFSKAIDIFEDVRTPHDQSYALLEFSEMEKRLGDPKKAKLYRDRAMKIIKELKAS